MGRGPVPPAPGIGGLGSLGLTDCKTVGHTYRRPWQNPILLWASEGDGGLRFQGSFHSVVQTGQTELAQIPRWQDHSETLPSAGRKEHSRRAVTETNVKLQFG